MRKLKFILLGLSLIILAAAAVINYFHLNQYYRYRLLAAEFECNAFPCTADFDGNRNPYQLTVEVPNSEARENSLLTVLKNGKELFQLPYDQTDSTFGTHVAITKDSLRARLLYFRGTRRGKPFLSIVYEWNGNALIPVAPSSNEAEILAALASEDDAGTRTIWLSRLEKATLSFAISIVVIAAVAYYNYRRSSF